MYVIENNNVSRKISDKIYDYEYTHSATIVKMTMTFDKNDEGIFF